MPEYNFLLCADASQYGYTTIAAATVEEATAQLLALSAEDLADEIDEDDGSPLRCLRVTQVTEGDDGTPQALDIPIDDAARREDALHFSDRDTALLLAGLRLLQRHTGHGILDVPDGIADILDAAGVGDDLRAEEIDRLCYRINEPDSYNPEDPAPPAQHSETPAALARCIDCLAAHGRRKASSDDDAARRHALDL